MRTRFWNYLFNSRVNLSHSNTFNVFSVDSATHPRPRVVCQSIYVIWFNFQYVIFDVLLFTHSIINWSLNHYLANLTKKDVLFCFLVFFWFNWYELFFKLVAGSRTFVEFLKSFVSFWKISIETSGQLRAAHTELITLDSLQIISKFTCRCAGWIRSLSWTSERIDLFELTQMNHEPPALSFQIQKCYNSLVFWLSSMFICVLMCLWFVRSFTRTPLVEPDGIIH